MSASAQRRVSADVQEKTLLGGKVKTVTKSVYCSNNGRLVASFVHPSKYILVTNLGGESRIYLPSVNEVMTPTGDFEVSSRDEMIAIAMSGRLDDLGLGMYGYRPAATERTEDGYIKKTFKSSGATAARGGVSVDIVYDNYLPIYCEYIAPTGKVVRRLYLSNYTTIQRLTIPQRMTSIEYLAAGDSSIVRTLYSNIRVDVEDPMFDFQIPADARPVSMPAPSRN